MATRKRRKAAKKPNTAAKKPNTAATKKPETAAKKPETAAIEKANELFTLLQSMMASPVTLSSTDAAAFQKVFSGLINSASLITKTPYTGNGNGTGNGASGAYTNGNYADASVQYLEYKNARLKDLIIDILLKK
jgi:hypothetical protein